MNERAELPATENESAQCVGLLMLDSASYASGLSGTALQQYAEERFLGQSNMTLVARHAEGCTIERLIYLNDTRVSEAMVAAARELVALGAEVITGDCGFMLRHQAAVRDAVNVPVILSGLLLIPTLLATLGNHQKLAVITASAESLSPDLIQLSGGVDLDRLVIGDMAGQPAFAAAIMDCVEEINNSAIEAETVDVVVDQVRRQPDIGAVLLECTALPPYAAAVQERVGLPVYDVVSLLEMMAGGLRPARHRQAI